jgi:hypothetical protein
MVISPDSMATVAGLTFTISQITWTTSSNDFVASTTDGMQIQSTLTTSPTPASVTTTLALALLTPASSSTTPATDRFLPRYQGKKIDTTDLINSIDQLGGKLSSTLTLVDLLQEQFTEHDLNGYNRST